LLECFFSEKNRHESIVFAIQAVPMEMDFKRERHRYSDVEEKRSNAEVEEVIYTPIRASLPFT
jgi:hypothetical protein